MKVTYNWLKDFVEIKISPRELADKLSMAGLEVTSLEEKDGDFIFEIEITSNRPDWLSVIGIAREVAAITNGKLISKSVSGLASKRINRQTGKPAGQLTINIENKNDCPLYTAKIIKNVKVGPSPDWLKKRLELIGCRSINNVVDVTNYVLFTYGQPLHAFDLDKLNGSEIIVRRLKASEKLLTIDGKERSFDKDILVIADQQSAVAIAGIIGGKYTEVTEGTKNILLESAIFNPIIIRRARQKLGVQTDSSYRFERGIDFETANNASWQAVKLINEICAGTCVLAKNRGLTKAVKRGLTLDLRSVSGLLGVTISAAKAKQILSRLDFKAKAASSKKLKIEIPSFRQDVKTEIDLVEEIARIYGYENIPESLPAFYPKVTTSSTKSLLPDIKNVLIGLGLNEIITYSLIDRRNLKGLQGEASDLVEILNPLSKEQDILRPTLIPSLLKCVAVNLNQKQEEIGIFEIASVFLKEPAKQPKEELVLSIALCGVKTFLLAEGAVKENLGVLHLKGILETLFERLGIKDYKFKPEDNTTFPIYIDKIIAGSMLILQKNTLDNFEIKNKEVVAAEISLSKVFAGIELKKKFLSLALYPAISRDISLLVSENTQADKILEIIKESAGSLLKEAKIIDYYKGKQIPAGFRNLTISCIYRSNERTLTDSEVNSLHSCACSALVEKLAAKIR